MSLVLSLPLCPPLLSFADCNDVTTLFHYIGRDISARLPKSNRFNLPRTEASNTTGQPFPLKVAVLLYFVTFEHTSHRPNLLKHWGCRRGLGFQHEFGEGHIKFIVCAFRIFGSGYMLSIIRFFFFNSTSVGFIQQWIFAGYP